jgi:hypothetical protein
MAILQEEIMLLLFVEKCVFFLKLLHMINTFTVQGLADQLSHMFVLIQV